MCLISPDIASSINPRTLIFSALEAFNILTRTSTGFLRADIEPNLLGALARFPMFCFVRILSRQAARSTQTRPHSALGLGSQHAHTDLLYDLTDSVSDILIGHGEQLCAEKKRSDQTA
jgi:hypothetical protein